MTDELFAAEMQKLQTGDPFDPSTDFGPLSSEGAAVRVLEQIQDAVDLGATIRTGGRRARETGAFVEPTILTNVTPQMRAYREEMFGPVAVVHWVRNVEDSIGLANDAAFGLGGCVFTTDPGVAERVVRGVGVGMMHVNSAERGGVALSFGGTKRSGLGRELGELGIDEFVNKKLVVVNPEKFNRNFLPSTNSGTVQQLY